MNEIQKLTELVQCDMSISSDVKRQLTKWLQNVKSIQSCTHKKDNCDNQNEDEEEDDNDDESTSRPWRSMSLVENYKSSLLEIESLCQNDPFSTSSFLESPFEESLKMKEIKDWLRSLRLHKYTSLLQNLSIEEMYHLTETDLELHHVTKGARGKILKSIQQIKERPLLLVHLNNQLDNHSSKLDLNPILTDVESILRMPVMVSSYYSCQNTQYISSLIFKCIGKLYSIIRDGESIDHVTILVYLLEMSSHHKFFSPFQIKSLANWTSELKTLWNPPTIKRICDLNKKRIFKETLFKTPSNLRRHSRHRKSMPDIKQSHWESQKQKKRNICEGSHHYHCEIFREFRIEKSKENPVEYDNGEEDEDDEEDDVFDLISSSSSSYNHNNINNVFYNHNNNHNNNNHNNNNHKSSSSSYHNESESRRTSSESKDSGLMLHFSEESSPRASSLSPPLSSSSPYKSFYIPSSEFVLSSKTSSELSLDSYLEPALEQHMADLSKSITEQVLT